MSKLLTLGILQQVQNSQGGGDDGVLYDGNMSVYSGGSVYGAFNSTNFNPQVSGWSQCWVELDDMDWVWTFVSNYPDIGSVIAHYEFGGTVYTSAESLYTYLESENDNTISLKVYEDAQ